MLQITLYFFCLIALLCANEAHGEIDHKNSKGPDVIVVPDNDDIDPSGYDGDDERDTDLPPLRQENWQGLIVVPVADLVTEALSAKHDNVQQAYKNIPVSWGPLHADKSICPRQHQALFNEVVTILGTNEHELCITLPNVVSTDEHGHQKSTEYWTLKENVVPLGDIPAQAHLYIPPPFAGDTQADANVITLAYPFYDPITRNRFSAGTRFVCTKSDHTAYTTYVYNHAAPGLQELAIPERYCVLAAAASGAERLRNFVQLVRSWTRAPGFIPLVWGGVSCTQRMNMEGFCLKYAGADQPSRGYWELHEQQDGPHSGFDASGLVLRAAQICGIPYFCKNSVDALRCLPHIDPAELQEGDLVWVPGGLLIVSDMTENKIIGAFGYQFGYGRVVECALSEVFEGIASYAELALAYEGGLALAIKDSAGTVVRAVPDYCFLRLK